MDETVKIPESLADHDLKAAYVQPFTCPGNKNVQYQVMTPLKSGSSCHRRIATASRPDLAAMVAGAIRLLNQ